MHYKVLVVDDSKLARMVMASAFRRIRPDWELIEATSAEEALDAISVGSVDIALVDFNMPVRTAWSWWRRFGKSIPQCRWRSSPPTCRTR